MAKAIDLTGQKYGILLMLEPTNQRERSSVVWKCKCDCGNIVYKAADTLRDGRIKSCGCHKYKSDYGTGFWIVYTHYKNNAIRRHKMFLLDETLFYTLITSPCYYCGIHPKQTGKRHRGFLHNGVDRVDNTKGYIEGNVVSCCKVCNRAKDIMTQEQFYLWIQSVSQHVRAILDMT